MGVLLGLGDVELVQAVLGQHLGEHVVGGCSGGKATGSGNSFLYSVMVTNRLAADAVRGRRGRSHSSKKARVSCRTRSGRKLKKRQTSPS